MLIPDREREREREKERERERERESPNLSSFIDEDMSKVIFG